jgi:uncharacterized membrane protein YuzA (DUF378 family)
MCKEGKCMCTVALVTKILVIVGAINWGLVGVGGLFGGDWNVVKMLLGSWPMVESIVYVLVGVAGVMSIFGCKCKTCKGMCDATPAAPAQQ